MAGFKSSVSCNPFVAIAALGVCLSLLRKILFGEIDDLKLLENGSLSFLDILLVVALSLGCCLPSETLGSSIGVSTCVSR